MEPTTTEEIKSNNTLLYVFLTTTVILMAYIGYIYSSYDMLKKGQLNEKYISKNDITFTMLPTYEQSQYVEYLEHTSKINELKKQLHYTQNNTNFFNTSVSEKIVEVERIVKVPVEKIVEVEKIIEVEKIVNVPTYIQDEVEVIEEIKKSNLTFNTYTCKNMDSGSINISKQCIQELYEFLDKNEDSKIFEVIGMVDNKDFKLVNTLKDVYGEKKIKHLSKYSQIGLSRQRVIEASWLIRKHLGNYKHIKTVNYTVNAKDKKGFVVRAYK